MPGAAACPAVPGGPGPKPLFRRFHNPQPLDRAPLDPFHPGAAVDVGDVEIALAPGQIDLRGNDRRDGPRRQRQRVEAARALRVKQDFVPQGIDQVDSHLFVPARHPRAQEVLAGERIRIFVLGLHAFERIVVADAHQVDRGRRPGANHGPLQVEPQAAIDDRQRAPGPVMARGKDANELLRAGNRPGVEYGPRRVGVVLPVDRVPGAVRVDGPHALGVTEIAIDVFPAVVEDAAVGQQRGVAFVQRVVADLLQVRAVGIHGVQVAHDVAIAHAILRLTGGGETDAAVGQIDRIDVREPAPERQLPSAAMGRDFIQVVIVGPVAAHGKENFPAVEAHVGIADHALGRVQ